MSSAVQADDDYVLMQDCNETTSSLWRVQVSDTGHKYIDVERQMRKKYGPPKPPPRTHVN